MERFTTQETEETVDAGFFSEEDLPEAFDFYAEPMEDLTEVQGRVDPKVRANRGTDTDLVT